MDKPVNLAFTKAEMKERGKGMPTAVAEKGTSEPKYPWGLTLRLDETTLKKLGMDKELPEVGELCQITGTGRVISVSKRENVDASTSDVEIQIEQMNLEVKEEDAEADDAFTEGAKKGRGRGGY